MAAAQNSGPHIAAPLSGVAAPNAGPIHLDLTATVGYPLRICLNSPAGERPLFWCALQSGELIEQSRFLQPPGLPLPMLLAPEQLAALPEAMLRIACAVPQRQFELLQAMLLSVEAFELAQANPLLFVLLVEHACVCEMSEARFLQLVCSKRRAILAELGLPASNSIVRILARTRLHLPHHPDLQAVLTVLRDAQLTALLRHVAAPGIPAYLFLALSPRLVWPGLLSMLSDTGTLHESSMIRRLVRDTQRLGANLATLQATVRLDELQALHDRLLQRFNELEMAGRLAEYLRDYGDYPPAPLPGNQQIRPLASWDELLEEGRVMHHCVGSYHWAVHQREVFIYQVLEPQRLTLSVRNTARGWILDELRGHANREPSAEAQDMVAKWLGRFVHEASS